MLPDISLIQGIPYFNYLAAILIVLVTFVIARLIIHIFENYLEAYAARTETDLDDAILGAIKRPLYLVVLVIGVRAALGYLSVPWLNEIDLAFRVIAIFIGTWIAYGITDILIKDYGYRLAKRTSTGIDDLMIPVVDKVAGIFIAAIGLMLILDALKIDITPMVAGMGIAGIAIALAAQETLSNMFSGFYLLVDKPFGKGDRIMLDGELCEAKDVGLRSTRLYNIIDHTIITMPNAQLANMKITNLSAPDTKLKISLTIGVAYGSDVKKVKQILTEVASNTPYVIDNPPPVVFFREFADCALNFLLIAWIDNLRKKFDAIDHINCEVNSRFEEEGIEIPFPIRTVYLRDDKGGQ